MNVNEKYPARVTLGEDGVYRWSYDMDMRTNHYLLNVLLKVTGVICAVLYLVMLVMLGGSGSVTAGMLLTLTLIVAGIFLLVPLGYWIAGLVMKWHYVVRFEMNEQAIMLVRKASTERMMRGLSLVSLLAGSAAGKPLQGVAQGAAMNSAADANVTMLSSVRWITEHRKYDALNLRVWFGGNQIWIPREDYDFVRDFLLTHIPEKHARVRESGTLKRIGIASLLSLAVNGIIVGVNLASFNAGNHFRIALSDVAGDTVRQRTVGMETIFLQEGAAREPVWWMNQLEIRTDTAVLSFLAVALVFFLILTLLHMIRRRGQR